MRSWADQPAAVHRVQYHRSAYSRQASIMRTCTTGASKRMMTAAAKEMVTPMAAARGLLGGHCIGMPRDFRRVLHHSAPQRIFTMSTVTMKIMANTCRTRWTTCIRQLVAHAAGCWPCRLHRRKCCTKFLRGHTIRRMWPAHGVAAPRHQTESGFRTTWTMPALRGCRATF